MDTNSRSYAWLVVLLLVPVALLNYLDRQMLATMKASMVGDIPSIANRADWGLILGCFKWTYAILSPFGGLIADRFSPPPRRLREPVRVVAGHVVDRARDLVPRTAGRAGRDGHQRGVLHPGRARPDRRLPPRPDRVARPSASTRPASTSARSSAASPATSPTPPTSAGAGCSPPAA
jgi:hypothetical protein